MTTVRATFHPMTQTPLHGGAMLTTFTPFTSPGHIVARVDGLDEGKAGTTLLEATTRLADYYERIARDLRAVADTCDLAVPEPVAMDITGPIEVRP